jgi:hypothetical protein
VRSAGEESTIVGASMPHPKEWRTESKQLENAYSSTKPTLFGVTVGH